MRPDKHDINLGLKFRFSRPYENKTFKKIRVLDYISIVRYL